MSQKRGRVFVTGMASVSPIGNTLDSITESLKNNRSGIVSLHDKIHPELPSRVAGLVQDPPIDKYVHPKEQKRIDRFIQLSIVSGMEAWQSAGIEKKPFLDKNRVGVISGIGMGGIPILTEQYDVMKKSGPRRVSPFLITGIIPNLASGHLSMQLGIKGVNLTIVSACASSAHALGEAFVKIRDGYLDAVLAGGAEALICDLTIAGFCSMRALSTGYNDRPAEASRPFDRDRDGFVMAEGASFLILESEESVVRRNATPVAEILGYGASGDAFHIAQPAPEGEGGARAMRNALEDAHMDASDIPYINAHGTATPVGDETELVAIAKVMGNHAPRARVSSTKSITGHMLGGAGSSEIIFSILSMNKGFLPATANLHNPIESYGLNIIANANEAMTEKVFMSNSFGFGGTNASIIVRCMG